MAQYQLENELIKITVDTHGAELQSLVKKETGAEYLWYGDPAYWGRRSPVLFPLVGQVKDGTFRVDGTSYQMGQHGFARDMEFALSEQSENTLWFVLESNAETLERFPYEFKLFVGYQLVDNILKMLWKVENPGQKQLDFSIGGHPAFQCPLGGGEQTDCYLNFHKPEKLFYNLLENGVVAYRDLELDTCGGVMPITSNLFDGDALIIENRQLTEVSLANAEKQDYLTVRFTSPLVGIWSPVGKHAPFVCIEPWYGRSDDAAFDGEWKDRTYGNSIQPNETFAASYEIVVL